jgi:hypothetical protein
MSISTTPLQVPPKKRGLGCLGCGCLVLALLVILFLALVAGGGYLGYTKIVSLTSTKPAAVPSFEGSDDLYRAAKQKLADFDHDLKNHQAATIQLSADEINALIARDPDVIKNHIHLFVTLANNEGRVQTSLPTDAVSHGIIKGRYFNLDASFGLGFDTQTKSVNLIPHALQFGDKDLSGGNADNGAALPLAATFGERWITARDNAAAMQSLSPAFNQSFNNAIRQNPDAAALLDQAKSIEIKDGELVIETR